MPVSVGDMSHVATLTDPSPSTIRILRVSSPASLAPDSSKTNQSAANDKQRRDNPVHAKGASPARDGTSQTRGRLQRRGGFRQSVILQETAAMRPGTTRYRHKARRCP